MSKNILPIICFAGLAAISLPGCSPYYTSFWWREPDLASPPFLMPDAFPLPNDAKILSKQCAAKGGNCSIAFESQMSLQSLFEFYRAHMSAARLNENSNYTDIRQASFNLSFYRWPEGKSVYINCADMGFKSERDYRMVSVQLE